MPQAWQPKAEVASRLAALPEVVAGSITSYAGGAIGHDPIRVGTAARARGLTPNIHLTCVSQDHAGLRKTLEGLQGLGIRNVFALTGDYPTIWCPSSGTQVNNAMKCDAAGLTAGLKSFKSTVHRGPILADYRSDAGAIDGD